MALIKEATIRASQSFLSGEWRRGFKKQSPQVQDIAELKYVRWRQKAETLNFEPKFSNIYVVEVTRDVHSICEVNGTVVRWLWIGNYKDYTAKLDALRKK